MHEATWEWGAMTTDVRFPRAADYEIRLLTHNVIYTWDGVIGNTSPDTTSPFHHDGQQFLEDLLVSGDSRVLHHGDRRRADGHALLPSR